MERGLGRQGQAIAVPALVQPVQQPGQPHGVDLPNAVDVGVVAAERRVAGGADHGPHAERMRPEQVGLQRHDGLVPGRHRCDGVGTESLAQLECQVQRAQVSPCGLLR